MSKSDMAEKDAAAVGMNIASEAITNIRTVASLRESFSTITHFCRKMLIFQFFFTGQENASISRFFKEMENVQQIARKRSLWRGLLNSLTQIIPGIAYGAALYVGGFMVANNELSVEKVIRLVRLVTI